MRISSRVGALLVLLLSFGCGGSTSVGPVSPSSVLPSTPVTTVSIVMGASALTTSAYSPNPVRLSVGSAVTWVNTDNTTHTSTADGGAWSSGSIAPGRSFTRTFTSTGTFTYRCTIHPGMVGSIEVQ